MPTITLSDLSLAKHDWSSRVKALREAYFRAMPEVCIERAFLVTKLSRKLGLFKKSRISSLDKARLYRRVLEKRKAVVWHSSAVGIGNKRFKVDGHSLFAGSTTTRFKGVPLYPEFMALSLWPELKTLSTRERNPYAITDKEIQILNEDVFPAWLDCNISELGRKQSVLDHGTAPDEATSIKLLEYLVFFLASKPNCISHTIPDFSVALKDGLRGIADKAKKNLETYKDDERRDFYAAIIEVMEGIIGYSRKLAAKARDMADEATSAEERKELLDLAQIHEYVPEHGARTFREGLTTVWMCWMAAHLENPNVGLSLGRLDQVLYPLYAKDVASGELSLDHAIELLCCLWLKIGDHVPAMPSAGEQLFGGTGSNQAITVGGIGEDGKDAVNDLTYVMLRATELLKLRDPNLNARYHAEESKPEYLQRLCQVNLNTKATPALHNDQAAIAALMAKGESEEDARDYGIVGCVEPTSNGRAYGHSGSILMNLISALELALFNGEHRHTGLGVLISKRTGDPRTFKTFEEFRTAFAEQTAWLAGQATTLNNLYGRVHQQFNPTPILSALFEGPMESGKDLIMGGAKINSSGVGVIGFADVIDSLAAIQKVVFVEKSLSFADLLKALQADYDGFEALRLRLRSEERTPKYGNEDPPAQAIAHWLAETLDTLYGAIPNYRGGHYRVGYWTMTNHAGFGRLSQATPNGRKAGENFTSGITPVSGETPGLTKVLNSVGSLPSKWLANGVAFNVKYLPGGGDQMLPLFVETVKTYFRKAPDIGGMEIQFNVIDRKTFEDAQADPAGFSDLLVRVSGYTAYFKDLNPQMQKEIIERTTYDLSTGHAVNFPPA